MMMARIIFKNKNGWSTCGPAFRKAETLEDLQKFAEKKAKGREFQIQLQSEEMTKRFADSAEAI